MSETGGLSALVDGRESLLGTAAGSVLSTLVVEAPRNREMDKPFLCLVLDFWDEAVGGLLSVERTVSARAAAAARRSAFGDGKGTCDSRGDGSGRTDRGVFSDAAECVELARVGVCRLCSRRGETGGVV